MKVERFLAEKPCLEETEAYLKGLRENGEVEITADILVPIEEWRQTLLAGKAVPYDTWIERNYVYKLGRAPKEKMRK